MLREAGLGTEGGSGFAVYLGEYGVCVPGWKVARYLVSHDCL